MVCPRGDRASPARAEIREDRGCPPLSDTRSRRSPPAASRSGRRAACRRDARARRRQHDFALGRRVAVADPHLRRTSTSSVSSGFSLCASECPFIRSSRCLAKRARASPTVISFSAVMRWPPEYSSGLTLASTISTSSIFARSASNSSLNTETSTVAVPSSIWTRHLSPARHLRAHAGDECQRAGSAPWTVRSA